MTIKEIVSKYGIRKSGENTLRIMNVGAAEQDNAVPTIRDKKPEILAFMAEQEATAERAKAERAAMAAGMPRYLVLEWAYNYGLSIVTARRFTDAEKPGLSEWYREKGFVSDGDVIKLAFGRFDVDNDDRLAAIYRRPSDGSFLSCDNQAWIITEEERDYIIVLNNRILSEKAAAEREEQVRVWRTVIAACERQMRTSRLYTAEEAREMRRRYNDLHNEGGEGYIPKFWTIDEYETAKRKVAECGEGC